jgi:hypothetical protein
MNGKVIITVARCDRCDGHHRNLEFAEFKRPLFAGGVYFNYWALCPATGEPIIMAVAPAGTDRYQTRLLWDATTAGEAGQ